MKPLIPLDVIMRAVIVPLIPSLIRLHDEEEDRPTVVVPRLPGRF
jgi:hypothetical protein